MMRSLIRWLASAAIGAAAAAAVLGAAAGCEQKRGAASSEPDQVYTVRGRIESLPAPDRPGSELQILHEPIPSFVNKDGKVVGMDTMVMPFTPAPGVSLEGLARGDIVEFTFEVRWKSRPYSQLTRIQKLPPDTTLNLGRAGG